MEHIVLPWSDWEIVKKLGAGGFGTVYEIVRRDEFGREEKAAVKIVSIPREQGEINSLRLEGYDDAGIAARYKDCAIEINNEYYLQRELKGHSNIVSVDENKIVPHEDGPGWDLFIRMELLHPMLEILGGRKTFSDREVIRLGKDICKALIVCHGRNVIHRDIKPDNIFRSDLGDWKLGDFGIARTMEYTTAATKAGTYAFMAPEVYHGERYGKEVDIYSLGMVLYWLMNNCHRPFLPLDRPPKKSEEDEARIKRFSGKYPIPAPLNGSEGLKLIVLKACSYNPKDRYTSAEEMYRELEAAEAGAYQVPASVSAEREGKNPVDALGSAQKSRGESAGSENESSASVEVSPASDEGDTRQNGWDEDGGGSIGDPRLSGGGKNKIDDLEEIGGTQWSVAIDNKPTDPVKKEPPGSDTSESGKKTGIIIPLIVAVIVAAFFLFREKSTSLDTSFCKDIYYKYGNAFLNNLDQLKVDYVNDSMETIAQKLQASGWSFLPYGEYEKKQTTPEIPDLSGDGEKQLFLHAVYPLPDANKCEIQITMDSESEAKSILFRGGADIHEFPSIYNEDGTWEKDLTNRSIALETQKRAFSGFLPSSLIGLLNEATWEDTGFTNEQIESLRSLLREGDPNKVIEWEDKLTGYFHFTMDLDLESFMMRDYNYRDYHLENFVKNLECMKISTDCNDSNLITSIVFEIIKEN